jgi:5-(carboxyamino)imidazole ribonucleotide synthase
MLPPGSTIGVLGAGQLARMLALAAAPLGLKTHVFAPDGDEPAFEVSGAGTIAAYEDEAALARFAEAVDVVTYEFENVPARTAELLAARRPVRPGPRALGLTQDRLVEKRFIAELGLPLAAFAGVDAESLEAAGAVGFPAVLKTRRLGYDGKGQARVGSPAELAAAFAAIGRQPATLEAFVPFAKEVSVVAARATDGAFCAYDAIENVHRDHILATSTAPAEVGPETAAEAVEAARRIAAALDYVGVLAVEFFVTREGALLVNEIAPRVHNSGHWTIEGAETSQFEQHVRAVAGWPLGPATRRAPRVAMENLVGDAARHWAALAAEPGAHLHLYGKAEARPGRKMGHVTRLLPGGGAPLRMDSASPH